MPETVLLLPGLMCDDAIWEHQSAALRGAGYQVLIPNFRGFDSLQAMAAAALALTEGPVAVAGREPAGGQRPVAGLDEARRLGREPISGGCVGAVQ